MTSARVRWLSVAVCVALLLPGLHVHPTPPPSSWEPASATTYVTDLPCLACSFSREGRTLPMEEVPLLVVAGEVRHVPQPVVTRHPAPTPRAAPLPPRGPPTA